MVKEIVKAMTPAIEFVAKHKSDILIAGGIGLMTAGTVKIAKAVIPVTESFDAYQNNMDDIDKARSITGFDEEELHREEVEAQKDFLLTVAKEAAPGVAMYILGTVSILGGYHIVKTDLKQMTAAAVSLEAAFEAYRKRVADKVGEEEEQDIFIGREKKSVGRGKNKTEEYRYNADDLGLFTFFYDDATFPLGWTNKGWMWNQTVLNQTEVWANDKLNTQGFLFLDDVLATLGMLPENANRPLYRQCGWIKNSGGDGYVSFGVHSAHDDEGCDIHTLNFNVDGIIADKFTESGLLNSLYPDAAHEDVVAYAEQMKDIDLMEYTPENRA